MSNLLKDASRQAVHSAALQYVKSGLSIIPLAVDGSKRPAFDALPRSTTNHGRASWATFAKRLPTLEEIKDWFPTAPGATRRGIAILGGAVSGGLEIMDFDQLDAFDPWVKIVSQQSPGLVERLVLVKTPRPGMHAYYRCADIGPNAKLAAQRFTDPQTGQSTFKCMIETRGEGGYCAAPPSPLGLHASGIYHVASHTQLAEVPIISSEERAILFAAARQLDRSPPKPSFEPSNRQNRSPVGGRPGDDFNARGEWRKILGPHGWTCVGEGAHGEEYWQRPGKSSGVSATVNYADTDLLYVFSTNAEPFEGSECYTKFQAYALLEHGGDFSSAATALLHEGYGQAHRRSTRSRDSNLPEYYRTTPLRPRSGVNERK